MLRVVTPRGPHDANFRSRIGGFSLIFLWCSVSSDGEFTRRARGRPRKHPKNTKTVGQTFCHPNFLFLRDFGVLILADPFSKISRKYVGPTNHQMFSEVIAERSLLSRNSVTQADVELRIGLSHGIGGGILLSEYSFPRSSEWCSRWHRLVVNCFAGRNDGVSAWPQFIVFCFF